MNKFYFFFSPKSFSTLVVKPIYFVKPVNYEDPSFFIGNKKLPKTDNYTYLGIPFDESLSLKPIQSKLNSNLNVKLNLYFRFLINKSVPLPLKKYVLILFILSLVIYYAPLFGSNKSRCSKAQKIINRGLYWSYGFKSRNSSVSLYNITRELRIPPLSAICAISQLRCFRKWKNSSCIINHLTNNIPTMSHYSWTKESRTLDKKLIGKKTNEIKKFYWERDVFKPSKAKKAIIYKENDFGFISEIRNLTFQYPKYQLGFFWISRIRCGFKFDISISIKEKSYINDKIIFLYNAFNRGNLTNDIVNNNDNSNSNNSNSHSSNSNNSYSNISISIFSNVSNSIENNVYADSSVCERVSNFLLGGRSINNSTREWKNLFKCQMKSGAYSDTPFLVVTAALLQSIIPIAIGQQWSLFNRFKSNRTTTTKSVNAEETVRQASRASATNEDHNFEFILNKNHIILEMHFRFTLYDKSKFLWYGRRSFTTERGQRQIDVNEELLLLVL
ncbi:hypothetical protein H8356DRAFT_1361105 [Neocallimastix lanati (nom. inval.)]|nr:hypothetical protein H8356DRAFT_1361105 [Neocallimastix sp. JGI-2020a]